MIKKCFACGVEKDLSVEVHYPYDDDSLTNEVPLPQLMTVECQGNVHRPSGAWDFRMAVLCHDCWHRLSQDGGIDMWIGERCWESLSPVRPFDSLPLVKDFPLGENGRDNDKWDAIHYD